MSQPALSPVRCPPGSSACAWASSQGCSSLPRLPAPALFRSTLRASLHRAGCRPTLGKNMASPLEDVVPCGSQTAAALPLHCPNPQAGKRDRVATPNRSRAAASCEAHTALSSSNSSSTTIPLFACAALHTFGVAGSTTPLSMNSRILNNRKSGPKSFSLAEPPRRMLARHARRSSQCS